jgi:hypothetical protein
MENTFIIESDEHYDIPVDTQYLLILPEEYTHPINYSHLPNLRQLLILSILDDAGEENVTQYQSSRPPTDLCLMQKHVVNTFSYEQGHRRLKQHYEFKISGPLFYPIPELPELPLQEEVVILRIFHTMNTCIGIPVEDRIALDLNFFPSLEELVVTHANGPLTLGSCSLLNKVTIVSDIFNERIDLNGNVSLTSISLSTPIFNRPLILNPCLALQELDLQSDLYDQYLDLTGNINLTNLIFNTPVFNNSNMALDLRANDKLELVTFRQDCIFNQSILFADICPELHQVVTSTTRMTHPLRFGKCDKLEYITVHHSRLILTHTLPKIEFVRVGEHYPHKIDEVLTNGNMGINVRRLVLGDDYLYRQLDLHLFRDLKYVDMKNNHDVILFLPTTNDISTFSLTMELTLTDIEYDDDEPRIKNIYIGPPPKKILKLLSTLPGDDRLLKVCDLGLLDSFFM